MKTQLKDLSIGQDFRLDTNRFYLQHHIYTLILIQGDKFTYTLKNDFNYNQKTTSSGFEKVISL